MATFAQNVVVAKDVATIIGATVGGLFTMYATLQGLRNWKNQLKGNMEQDLCRKIVRSVAETEKYFTTLLDELAVFGKCMAEINLKEWDDLEILGTCDSNKTRFERIKEMAIPCRVKLDKYLLYSVEGRALWGKEFSTIGYRYLSKRSQILKILNEYIEYVDKVMGMEKSYSFQRAKLISYSRFLTVRNDRKKYESVYLTDLENVCDFANKILSGDKDLYFFERWWRWWKEYWTKICAEFDSPNC